MEDCIERYVSQKRAGVKKASNHHEFATAMENINRQMQDAGSLLDPNALKATGPASAPALPRNPVPSEPNAVGINQAKGDLLELLGETGREPEKLRVISIVGFGGTGKATLATAVFNSVKEGVAGPRFHLCAMVDTAPDKHAEVPRSRKNTTQLLREIIKQFCKDEKDADAALPRDFTEEKKTIKQFWKDEKDADTACPEAFITKEKLEKARYLIVLIGLDDEGQGKSLISTFRDKGAAASRIIVTTRTETAANIFNCNENDYVYNMRKLGQTESRAILKVDHPVQQKLVEKCDGHPLALYSVNEHVRRIRNRSGRQLEFVCKHLGSFLHKHNPNSSQSGTDCFEYLGGVIVDAYTGLSNRHGRSSMLYLGIFSNDGHLVKKNKITRRWVAEGYCINDDHMDEQDVAEGNFEELIERDIIQPVSIRKGRSMTSNKCRTRGIVHEFVLHKGISEDFILSTSGPWEQKASAEEEKEKVRHIFISDSKDQSSGNLDLSRVRSLTISSSRGPADAFSKFSEYKLMRVLDLEECADVNNSHVTAICQMWNLRYLSLGPQITELPGKITQLPFLESLHISKKMDTQLETKLPVEVIGMRYLLHLTGKFRILYKTEEVTKEQCKNSSLETFAGFIADDNEIGLLLHMSKMTKLKKVKIWCCEPVIGDANKKVTSDANKKEMEDQLHNQLVQAIQRCTISSKENKGEGSKKSMSIDFQGLARGSQRALEKLNETIKAERYSLGSLKLHDKSFDPAKATLLTDNLIVTKLCLSLTTVEQDILSKLGAMNSLLHLKLIADNINGNLVMEAGKFLSLESLCFKVSGPSDANVVIEVLPTSLPELVSLQLLCEHLYVNHIEHLTKLQDIELHHKVKGEARRPLETAARNHLNKPRVLPFVADDEENSDAGAAAEEPAGDQGTADGEENSDAGAAAEERAGDQGTANGQKPPPPQRKKRWKLTFLKKWRNGEENSDAGAAARYAAKGKQQAP